MAIFRVKVMMNQLMKRTSPLIFSGGLSTWLPGETTSMQLNTAPRPGATTLVAVSVETSVIRWVSNGKFYG